VPLIFNQVYNEYLLMREQQKWVEPGAKPVPENAEEEEEEEEEER
jgi:hypothetical protein